MSIISRACVLLYAVNNFLNERNSATILRLWAGAACFQSSSVISLAVGWCRRAANDFLYPRVGDAHRARFADSPYISKDGRARKKSRAENSASARMNLCRWLFWSTRGERASERGRVLFLRHASAWILNPFKKDPLTTVRVPCLLRSLLLHGKASGCLSSDIFYDFFSLFLSILSVLSIFYLYFSSFFFYCSVQMDYRSKIYEKSDLYLKIYITCKKNYSI